MQTKFRPQRDMELKNVNKKKRLIKTIQIEYEAWGGLNCT